MRKYRFQVLTALTALAALALSACGGGSAFGSGTSGTSGSTPTQAVASVTLLSSSPQMPSNNSQPATITALVRDASNVVIQNATVAFSTTSGLIVVTNGVTDANGEATATLSTPGDYTTRTITVTAAVGKVTGTVPVDVVGTTLTMVPQSGSGNIVDGSTATYLLTLLDSGGNGIADQAVAVTSAKGNTLSSANLTTDSNGQATVTVTGTVSGTDTLTATAAGQTAQQSLVVSNQNFAMTTPTANALIPLNTLTPVSVTWTSSSVPVSGQTITFTTTRGSFTPTTAPTNPSGVATVDVSSTTAGPAIITATGGTGSNGVTAQVAVTFVATTPASITVQASPDTISTSAQSTITAVVRDAQNNLVDGQTVDFQLTDVTGGSISTASAVTNTQGVAQTVYTASSTASATNGVKIEASVQSAPSIAGTVDLTVGGQTAFLSLGTGATISENDNKTQFIMPFSVQAVDARGNALPNIPISLTIHSSYPSDAPGDNLTAYFKGGWIVSGSDWVQTGTPTLGTLTPITACLNEDLAENGILEPGEDINGNGKLWPGNIATVSPGSLTTDSTGSAEFSVIYPEDHAMWVRVTLTATATVSGTENSSSTIFVLPILASYVTTTTSSPPGQTSPYGIGTACTDSY